MTYTGNENHDITLSEAAEMTKNFRDINPTGEPIAHYFGKDAIKDIMDQEGCVGIRIYYGLNDDGKKQLIVTGVLSTGNDMYNGLLAERSITCPLDCSAANPLNSSTT